MARRVINIGSWRHILRPDINTNFEDIYDRIGALQSGVPPVLYDGVPTEVVNMSQWGVIPGNGIDNAQALLNMRMDLKDTYNKHYLIDVPESAENSLICSSDNRYLADIIRCSIRGLNTGFKTLTTSIHEGAQRPFNTGDLFTRDLWSQYSGSGPIYCPIFALHSANAGDKKVYFKDPAGAQYFEANAEAGKMAFIFQRDIVLKDYPPACMYHTWPEIESVSTLDNSITFVEPLEYDLNEDYPYSFGSFGENVIGIPQICLLDRPNWKYARRIHLENLNLLKPDAGPADRSGTLQFAAYNFVVKNAVVHGHNWPAYNYRNLQENVTVEDEGYNIMELDKLCRYVDLNNCNIKVHVNNGTAIEKVTMRNTYLGDLLNIAPREIDLENVTINAGTKRDNSLPAWTIAFSGTYIRKIRYKNMTFTKSPGNNSRVAIDVHGVGKYTPLANEGKNVIVPAGFSPDNSTSILVRCVEEKQTKFFNRAGTKPYPVLMQKMNQRANGDVECIMDSPGFATGEQMLWPMAGQIIDEGGHTYAAGFQVKRGGRITEVPFEVLADEQVVDCFRNVATIQITGPCILAKNEPYQELFYSPTQGTILTVNAWIKTVTFRLPDGVTADTKLIFTFLDNYGN